MISHQGWPPVSKVWSTLFKIIFHLCLLITFLSWNETGPFSFFFSVYRLTAVAFCLHRCAQATRAPFSMEMIRTAMCWVIRSMCLTSRHGVDSASTALWSLWWTESISSTPGPSLCHSCRPPLTCSKTRQRRCVCTVYAFKIYVATVYPLVVKAHHILVLVGHKECITYWCS